MKLVAPCLLLAMLAGWKHPSCFAQAPQIPLLNDPRKAKIRQLPDRLPDHPSINPAFTIPVEPLGFSPPGALYLGSRNSLASLDFVDENRILFTFRVPGLMHRDENHNAEGDARQIRALVLDIATGSTISEALWTVHDRARYLWMLKDGKFLLRDRDDIQQGDAKLDLRPLLHFPGAIEWLELDPTQTYLVTNSDEPANAEPKTGDVPSPATAKADVKVDDDRPGAGAPDRVVRILHRESGKVMLVSRTRMSVHLPVNDEGYIESLRGNADQWVMNLVFFKGGSRTLGRIKSDCAPGFDFVSKSIMLVSTCDERDTHLMTAVSTDGRRLWDDRSSPQAIWPLLVTNATGNKVARETLIVEHAVNAFTPLSTDDIKGQLVRVYDAETGNVALEAQASPPLDAGGNVAISPSGKRAAVVSHGAIQVFDLSETAATATAPKEPSVPAAKSASQNRAP